MQPPTIDKIVQTPQQRWLNAISRINPGMARHLFLLPLIVASAVVLFVCANSVVTRLSMQFPLDWWESMFIVDAARAIHNQPVYEKLGTGHATHMYGPLGTYTMAAMYHFTGVTVNAGRWLALIGGIGSTLLFVLAFVERRTLIYLLIGTAIYVSLHIRCVDLFTNTRPDSFAFLLSTIALFAAYRAVQRSQPIWYLLTAILTVTAFLYKQPYAVTALVPPLAVLFVWPQNLKRQLIASFIPLAAMVIAGAVMRFGFRNIWFYMVTVPKLYLVRMVRVPLGIECLFMYNTIYLGIAALVVFGAGLEHLRDNKTKWLFASMIIGGGMGILAFSKQGGTYNSLLLIYAPMAAFCMLKLPQAVEVIMSARVNLITRVVCSLTLAFLLTGTAFGTPLMMRLAFDHASNTADFAKAVAFAKTLDGKVLCPDEPVLTYFALGQFDKNLEAEVEAVGSGRRLQAWLSEYLTPRNPRDKSGPAKYVISVGTNDMPSRTTRFLARVGFKAVPTDKLGTGYILWQRTSTITQSTTR